MLSFTISLILCGEISTFLGTKIYFICRLFILTLSKVYGVYLHTLQAYNTLARLAQSVARRQRVVSGGLRLFTQKFQIWEHHLTSFMFLWSCIMSKAWRKNTNKMQQYRWFIVNYRCWLLTTVSTCFGHLYAHHQEKKDHVLLHMGLFAGSVGWGWLLCCGATL